jgi:DNA polymerase III alpha subunit
MADCRSRRAFRSSFKVIFGSPVLIEQPFFSPRLRHPVEFLRAELAGRRIDTCAEPMAARWLEAADLVLVRQAKGVMFITIEDETGVANLVVWPSLFERQRRVVLSTA